MNFDAAALWTILKKNLYCPETELFYDYRTSADPAERFALLPTAEEIGVDFPNPCGWGTGMEDCSLNGGLALELCRIYEPDCGFASQLVSGLERCAYIHGRTGFAARGVSVRAPLCCYSNTSRDQLTLAVYGVWRVIHSMAPEPRLRKRCAALLAAYAVWCERVIVPENDFSFRRLDGRPALVSKMWECDAHEMLRLPMVYAAAFEATGDEHWRELACTLLEPGLEATLRGDGMELWWDLPPEDTFQVLKRVYKIPEAVYRENLKRYADILGAQDFLKQPVRQLSLGQRMRAEILAVLLHAPKILFLDEPTIGLDVAVKKQIRDLLRIINRETGVTVLLTSHDMKDIDTVCDRMIVIDHGRLAVDDAVENVKKKYGTKETVEIEVEGDLSIQNQAEAEFLLPRQAVCVREGNLIRCSYDRKDLNAAAVIQAVMDRYKILDVKVKEADIDDVVEEIYREGADGRRQSKDRD